MKLDRVCFLAAYTSRSCAYAEALRDARLEPQDAILFGGAYGDQLGQQRESVLKLDGVVADLHSTVQRVTVGDVNEREIIRAAAACSPKLIIYSGYGGQIIRSELLELGIPILHLHAGWLPDYRGSTTTYYSILVERRCGVSAIIMSSEIDHGTIVAQRWFAPPGDGVEIDHGYDARIRSELLVDVMREWQIHGRFLMPIVQRSEEGRTYYIIHPVLKHLAMLSLSHRE